MLGPFELCICVPVSHAVLGFALFVCWRGLCHLSMICHHILNVSLRGQIKRSHGFCLDPKLCCFQREPLLFVAGLESIVAGNVRRGLELDLGIKERTAMIRTSCLSWATLHFV